MITENEKMLLIVMRKHDVCQELPYKT